LILDWDEAENAAQVVTCTDNVRGYVVLGKQ